MSIYQFLIAVRQRDGEVLQNSEGETTRYALGQRYSWDADGDVHGR
jgi:flap endonuclease-1